VKLHNLLIRSSEFEVAGDGRTLEGLAFRWDAPSLVSDFGGPRYLEEFAQRSANQTLRMRAWRPLFVEHDYVKGSVGETTFERSDEGLMFRARATDSRYAVATLARVHAGELPGVSVGFRSIASAKRPDPRGIVTTRTEIAIEELSLARQAMYEGAGVLTVRAETETPRLDALRRRRLLTL